MINQVLNEVGSGLDKLMNLVPLPGKVTIMPVKKYAPVPIPNGAPFVAMFNPEQWASSEQFVYNDEQEEGTPEGVQRFNHIRSPELSFEILIDGTGASGEKKEVTAELESLNRTVGFNGQEHRPNKLIIVWGTFIFQGVVESVDITYTLFRPNGTPLRAKVQLKFRRDTDSVTRVLDADLRSADLTHVRTLREGERLDQLCHAIYESPRFLLEVAAANGLTSFRSDLATKSLLFPPIEK
ncbi:MAG: hypothetical protein J5I98_21355 [Phaeodactylibacter sp.]|nr:hypothetical protein [Phaeodactylibacter sp.]